MLRLIYGVQREGISFAELHKHFKRATPMMWGNYTTAQAMWEAVNIQATENITAKLTINLLVEQRRGEYCSQDRTNPRSGITAYQIDFKLSPGDSTTAGKT